MTGRGLAAVLWDMDGTLIDSEPAWMRAQAAIVEEFGGTWTEADGLALVGTDMQATADALRDAGVPLDDDEIIDQLVEVVTRELDRSVDWRPGAVELVVALRDAGVPQAIVTTSPRSMVAVVVAGLPDGAIKATVTGDDVACGKPDPEPYLLAAHLLGVGVERCIAIEDSPTGLASAIAAGVVAIGVPNQAVLVEDGTWRRFESLVGVDVAELTKGWPELRLT